MVFKISGVDVQSRSAIHMSSDSRHLCSTSQHCKCLGTTLWLPCKVAWSMDMSLRQTCFRKYNLWFMFRRAMLCSSSTRSKRLSIGCYDSTFTQHDSSILHFVLARRMFVVEFSCQLRLTTRVAACFFSWAWSAASYYSRAAPAHDQK